MAALSAAPDAAPVAAVAPHPYAIQPPAIGASWYPEQWPEQRWYFAWLDRAMAL